MNRKLVVRLATLGSCLLIIGAPPSIAGAESVDDPPGYDNPPCLLGTGMTVDDTVAWHGGFWSRQILIFKKMYGAAWDAARGHIPNDPCTKVVLAGIGSVS